MLQLCSDASRLLARVFTASPVLGVLLLAIAGSCAFAEEWKRHVVDDGSRGADGVRLADVDGDGRLDIVTPWEEGGDVRVAFDLGLSASTRWRIESVGREPSVEDAVAADLDGDGQLEIVAAAEGRAKVIRVFDRQPALSSGPTHVWNGYELGNSRGQQQFMFCLPRTTDEAGLHLISGGKNANASITIWRPTADRGDYASWSGEPIRKAGWIMSLQSVDMNGDDISDLLLSDRKGPQRGIWWMPGTTTGIGENSVLIGGRDKEVMFLTAEDFDGDGDIDVAAAAHPQSLLLYERISTDGTQWNTRTISLPAEAGLGKGIAIETRHGATEIFVSSEPLKGPDRLSIVRFIWNDLSTVMTADPDKVDTPGGTAGTKFDRMELIDLDGDGDRDLLTCEERENLGVVWYERP